MTIIRLTKRDKAYTKRNTLVDTTHNKRKIDARDESWVKDLRTAFRNLQKEAASKFKTSTDKATLFDDSTLTQKEFGDELVYVMDITLTSHGEKFNDLKSEASIAKATDEMVKTMKDFETAVANYYEYIVKALEKVAKELGVKLIVK